MSISQRPTNQIVKNLTSGIQFDWWKKAFSLDAHDARDARSTSVILWTRLYTCTLSFGCAFPHQCLSWLVISAVIVNYTNGTACTWTCMSGAAGMHWCCVWCHVNSVKVTIQSFSDSSLDQSHDVTVSNTCGSPTDDFMMNIHHGNPSPFSHKRTLYSSSAKVHTFMYTHTCIHTHSCIYYMWFSIHVHQVPSFVP